jgi:hypothetical protein
MRHKGFHIVGVHKSLSFISDFILKQMNEKLRRRTRLYSNFKDFKEIDKKFLPKEYGGKIPMSDMISNLFRISISFSAFNYVFIDRFI